MSSERHRRVESLVRELVASYLTQHANPNPLITVTQVSSSPDYRQMTVYITTIPAGEEAAALAFLKRSGRDIRGHVKRRSNLKQIPFLSFAVDAGERHRQHIDDIARQVEQQTTPPDDVSPVDSTS